MYRASGIGVSIVLVAVGAVLAWAVDAQVSGVDLQAVGVIVFVVGLVGLVVSLLLASLPARRVRDTTVVDDPARRDVPVVSRERIEY